MPQSSHDDVVEDLHRTELRIDCHQRGVRSVAEDAGVDLGPVGRRHLQPAAVDVLRQALGPDVPGLRDLAQADRGRGSDYPAAFEAHLGLAATEQRRADPGDARQQRPSQALPMAPPGHHHAARGVGAGRERRRAGVAVHHPNLRESTPSTLVRDLRQRGLHALAVRVHADAHLEPAIGRHPHGRLVVARHQRQAPGGEHAGAVRRLLAIAGEADADQAAVGLAQRLACTDGIKPNRLPHPFQTARIVAAVVVLARDVVVRHLLGRHQILGRTSYGSRPTARAIASISSSIAKHTPVRATPRYGMKPGLLVATQ